MSTILCFFAYKFYRKFCVFSLKVYRKVYRKVYGFHEPKVAFLHRFFGVFWAFLFVWMPTSSRYFFRAKGKPPRFPVGV